MCVCVCVCVCAGSDAAQKNPAESAVSEQRYREIDELALKKAEESVKKPRDYFE